MVPTSEQTTEVVVQTHGDVNRWERDYARDKIDRLRSMVGAPVLFARVDLRIFSDPARERPADAKASLDVNGSLVRAHVAAATITTGAGDAPSTCSATLPKSDRPKPP